MEQHQVRLLPVVGETGELVGLVSEEHILGAWGEDPLRPVLEVMAECGPPGEEAWDEEGTALGWYRAEAQGWVEQASGI